LAASPLIVTVALAAPAKEGAKTTLTEHLPFGPTCPLQVVETENSSDPKRVPPLKVTVAPPFLGAVLVKPTTLTLLRPTLTVPKFKKLVETFTTADTRGVGVAIGAGVGVGFGVGVGAGAGVVVAVGIGVGLVVGVAVGLVVGVGVGVVVGVGVGLVVGVGVGVVVGVGVGLVVGVGVGVAVGVGVGVALELELPAYAFTKVAMSTVPQPVVWS
jgi:hypothetical protein